MMNNGGNMAYWQSSMISHFTNFISTNSLVAYRSQLVKYEKLNMRQHQNEAQI